MSSSNEAAELIQVNKAAEAITKMNKSVNKWMTEFKSNNMKNGHETLTNGKRTASAINRVIGCMLNIIKDISETDKLLENKSDSNGTKSEADKTNIKLRKSLLFWGVVSTGKEELTSEIVEIVCVYTGVQITNEDIRYCYRYSRVAAGKELPALVRFQSSYIFSLVWKSRNKLKDTNITMEIHIPMCMRSQFSTARKVFGNHKCFKFEKYVVVITPDKQAHFLESHLQLQHLSELWLEKK